MLGAIAVPAAALAQTQSSYRYDALGRLVGSTQQTGSTPTVATTIEYDAAGNRVTYRVNGASAGGPAQPTPAAASRRVVVLPINGLFVMVLP